MHDRLQRFLQDADEVNTPVKRVPHKLADQLLFKREV